MQSPRRSFLRGSLISAIGTAGVLPASILAKAGYGDNKEKLDDDPLQQDASDDGKMVLVGNESIAMFIYPGFTALDLFGPHHLFSLMSGAKVHLVAESNAPVKTDTGVLITPTMDFDHCPEKLTILFVPGGLEGTLKVCENPKVREFLKQRGEQAEWVSSVCTGSLVLGAAGLLNGYKATSHWLVRSELAHFGAIPTDERVVIDRNRVTGAGVTAGIDFGLKLVQELRGKKYAQAAQLFSEYDPKPGLTAGSETTAPPETVAMLRSMHRGFGELVKEIANKTRG